MARLSRKCTGSLRGLSEALVMVHSIRGNHLAQSLGLFTGAGERRHDEPATVDGRIGVIDAFRHGYSSGRRSRFLQAIRRGGAQPGAWRIVQSGLRQRYAGRAMVDRLCGALPVVPRQLLCCDWRRARRSHPVSEKLPPLKLAVPASGAFRILTRPVTNKKGRPPAALFASMVQHAYWQRCRRPSSPLIQLPGWQTKPLRA